MFGVTVHGILGVLYRMASLFESAKNFLSSAHRGSIVGVDMGTSSIKIVEIEKRDERAVLKNYGELALGPLAGVGIGQATHLPPEKLAEALRELLKETGITAHHISFAIPFSASLLVIVQLPDVGDSKLESMVTIEARRYIPVPMSEITLNWWALPKRQGKQSAPSDVAPVREYREVILAAVHNDVFKQYETLRQNTGLTDAAVHFEMEIFSMLRSVVGRDLEPMVVIDIGAGTTKVVIVDEGVVRGSHIISMGGQDITLTLAKALNVPFVKAEEMKRRAGIMGNEEGRDVLSVAELLLSTIFNETKRVVQNYEQRYDRKIEKVVLMGGGALLKGLSRLAAGYFPEKKVIVGDPFSRVDAPAFLAPTLRSISPNFSIALGIALKGLEE